MSEKKKCTKCHKKKDPSGFYAHPRTADHLQSWCRECIKIAADARNKRVRSEKAKAEA